MSFKLHINTDTVDNRGNRVAGRQSIGGAKTLAEAQKVAASQLESRPGTSEVIIVDAEGKEVEKVARP